MINNEIFDSILPFFVIIKLYAGGANDNISFIAAYEKVSS